MNIREIRQQEAVDSYYPGGKGIIGACPRFGKIKVSIDIMRRDNPKKVLIAYPRTDIKTSWLNDFKYWGFDGSRVTFTTHQSMKKITEKPDLIIIDEIQEASYNELKSMVPLVKSVPTFGLSGTMTEKTTDEIFYTLGLRVCYEYSIEQGVKEGILSDYQIIIHKVPLSTRVTGKYKDKYKKPISEKRKFDNYAYVREKLKKDKKDYFFLEKNMISLLQSSESRRDKTVELLQQFKGERVLVFCGLAEIADSLGIPAYHSKNKDKQLFEDFCNGIGDHMVTIHMMQSGITIKPISKGIMNYTSGAPESSAQKICRFLTKEYNYPDKLAEIHMTVSDEEFELGRLKTALMFFSKSKIKYESSIKDKSVEDKVL